ncbi:MAG: hypothetical protein AB7P76_03090 [Candidatus Melainabacteria bacterium]
MSRFSSSSGRFTASLLGMLMLGAAQTPAGLAADTKAPGIHNVSLEQTLPLAGKVESNQTAPLPPASTAGLRILFDRWVNFQNEYDPRLHRIFTRSATLTFADPNGGPDQRVTVNSHQLHDFIDALTAVNQESGRQVKCSMVMLHAFNNPRHVGRITFYQTVNLIPDDSFRGELVAREDAKGSWRIQSGEFEVRDKSHLTRVMGKYQEIIKAREEAREARIREQEEARRQREQAQQIAEAQAAQARAAEDAARAADKAAEEAARTAEQSATPAPVTTAPATAAPVKVNPHAPRPQAVSIPGVPAATPAAKQGHPKVAAQPAPAKTESKPAAPPASSPAASPSSGSNVPPWLRKN